MNQPTHITITGAKGGVGTSVTAVGIATALGHIAEGDGTSVELHGGHDLSAILGKPRSAAQPTSKVFGNVLADPAWRITDRGVISSVRPAGDYNLLVTRPCYLALRNAVETGTEGFHGVILLTEDGRSLRAGDVARALDLPVVAELAVSADIARAVDAGTMARGSRYGVDRTFSKLIDDLGAPLTVGTEEVAS